MAQELSRLQPVPGSRKSAKRLGRGQGSGLGKTSGKGQKGQKSRAGGGVRPGFEGGQMPLARRLPKRGFFNIFASDYTIINIGDLQGRFQADTIVDLPLLKALGIVAHVGTDGLKVLGGGELTVPLTIKAAKFTATAAEKIVAAGGKAEAV
jgi:large subunit ribosomal protein L15